MDDCKNTGKIGGKRLGLFNLDTKRLNASQLAELQIDFQAICTNKTRSFWEETSDERVVICVDQVIFDVALQEELSVYDLLRAINSDARNQKMDITTSLSSKHPSDVSIPSATQHNQEASQGDQSSRKVAISLWHYCRYLLSALRNRLPQEPEKSDPLTPSGYVRMMAAGEKCRYRYKIPTLLDGEDK